jgi:hypothetical protein
MSDAFKNLRLARENNNRLARPFYARRVRLRLTPVIDRYAVALIDRLSRMVKCRKWMPEWFGPVIRTAIPLPAG